MRKPKTLLCGDLARVVQAQMAIFFANLALISATFGWRNLMALLGGAAGIRHSFLQFNARISWKSVTRILPESCELSTRWAHREPAAEYSLFN